MSEQQNDVMLSVPLDRGIHEAVRVLLERFQSYKGIKVDSVAVRWIDVTTYEPGSDLRGSYLLDSVVIESEQKGSR